MKARSAKDLEVYQKAYSLSMQIFRLSKDWSVEERYTTNVQDRQLFDNVSDQRERTIANRTVARYGWRPSRPMH